MFDTLFRVDDPDWLEGEIVRLTARPYPVIGVPMYLTTEDLSALDPMLDDRPDPVLDPMPDPGALAAVREDDRLAAAFDVAIGTLQARRGPLSPRDIANVVEVLAEHSFLDRPFSALGDVPDVSSPER